MTHRLNADSMFLKTEESLMVEIEKAVEANSMRLLASLMNQAFVRGILKKSPTYYYGERLLDLADKYLIRPWKAKKKAMEEAKKEEANLQSLADKYPLTVDILDSKACVEGLINSIAYGIDENMLAQYINMHARLHGADKILALDYWQKRQLAFLLLRITEEELEAFKAPPHQKRTALQKMQKSSLEFSLWLGNERRRVTVFRYGNTNTYYTPNLCTYRKDPNGKRRYAPIKVVASLARWKVVMDAPQEAYEFTRLATDSVLEKVFTSAKNSIITKTVITVGKSLTKDEVLSVIPYMAKTSITPGVILVDTGTDFYLSRDSLCWQINPSTGNITYGPSVLVRTRGGSWRVYIPTGFTPINFQGEADLEIGDLVTLPNALPQKYRGIWIIKSINRTADYVTANIYRSDSGYPYNSQFVNVTVPVSFLKKVEI